MCVVGPLGRVARPPGVRVVLVVALDLGAGREPGLADQHRHAGRRRDQRLDREPLGLDRPLLDQLAAERERRVLAGVDRAAGAERPHPGPGRDPLGAAAGEPAALVVAHDAQHRQRAGGVTEQPQRPAHLLQLERQPVVGDREVGQPRRDAVVRRRAAAAQVGDRAVGLGRLLRRRLVAGPLQREDTRSGGQGPRARIPGG